MLSRRRSSVSDRGEVVGHPAFHSVCAGGAKLLRGDLDAERAKDHRRTGGEERCALGHDDQICKDPGERAVTGGDAEHQRDDGHLALKVSDDLQVVRCEGVAFEHVRCALACAVQQ